MSNPKLWVGPPKIFDENAPDKPLPKLVIHGVEAQSPLGERVIAHFHGHISQFYLAQAQNYALSDSPSMQAHREHPDLKLRYNNTMGAETIHVAVHPDVLKHLARPQPKPVPDYWDYALIELFVPNMYNAAQLYCYAQITTPRETALTALSTLPWAGVASVTDDHIPLDSLINAATQGLQVRKEIDAASEVYASFIVDLRPARGLPAVSVDLHPYLYAGDVRLPGYVLVYANDPISLDTFPDLPPPLLTYAEALNSSIYISQTGIGTIPTAVFVGGTWVLAQSGGPAWNYDAGYGVRNGVTFHGWERWYVIDQHNGYPGYIGPKPTPAEVQVTVFKGVPPFDVTKYTGPAAPYCRWTFKDIYPRRPGHQTPSKNVPVPVYTNTDLATHSTDLVNFYGTPRAGTVTIDLTTGSAFWGRP